MSTETVKESGSIRSQGQTSETGLALREVGETEFIPKFGYTARLWKPNFIILSRVGGYARQK
jgi:hypothetical protein